MTGQEDRFIRRAGRLWSHIDIMKAAYPNIDQQALRNGQQKLLLVRQLCTQFAAQQQLDVRRRIFEDLAKLAKQEYETLRRMLRAPIHFTRQHPFVVQSVRQSGRPAIKLSRPAIRLVWSLRDKGATWSRIAKSLHISRSTLYLQLRQHPEWKPNDLRTRPEDEIVKQCIREFAAAHPGSGERILLGHVRAQLGWVSRQFVRDTIRIVDPVGVGLRAFHTIKRRIYRVRGANALWHHDANMKLERWGFIFHGIIDGYSRLLVSMQCSNNKRETTVLRFFKDATKQYGVPARVRGDRGKENNAVEKYMQEYRGQETMPYLRGRSIHNVRIERIWVDLWKDVSNRYDRLFYRMARKGYLCQTDRLHISVLHLIFQPRMQATVNEWINSWNHHSIRTANGESPIVLWEASRLQAYVEGWYDSPGDEATLLDQSEYGIDPHRLETQHRRASQAAARGDSELGKHAPSDEELAAARLLLQGYEDDMVADMKGKVSFRKAIKHAEEALMAADL